jgi:hypothetical protein
VTRFVRDPAQHVFLAGDGADVALLGAVIAGLPLRAYGQLVLALAPGAEVPALPVPARVQVTVHRAATLEERADRVAAASSAWLREWMPGDPERSRGRFTVWLGCAASERVGELDRAISGALEAARGARA